MLFRRKNYFIKKGFQTGFAARFFTIIILESVLALALFLYLSKGTITTGYIGEELTVLKTRDFFLPTLVLAYIAIVAVTGILAIITLIFISHRIAGPLYRFEKTLDTIKDGDLTHRFNIRENDELRTIADSLNEFTKKFDEKIGGLKSQAREITLIEEELRNKASSEASWDKETLRLADMLREKAEKLKDAATYFKTSKNINL